MTNANNVNMHNVRHLSWTLTKGVYFYFQIISMAKASDAAAPMLLLLLVC